MFSYLKVLLFLTLVATACASITWGQLFEKHHNRKSLPVKPNHTKLKQVYRDMPAKSDLDIYLKALEGIIKFSAANMNDIDLNFAFGLFLINVNLKTIIKHRPMNTPLLVLQPIRELVRKNTALLRFFQHMVKKDKTPRNKKNKAIYSLFNNDTIWIERLERYDAVFKTAETKRSYQELTAIYKTWEQYIKHIYDWEKRAIPGPKLSDYCVSSLGKSLVEVRNSVPLCILPPECYNVLVNGSNSGYALTHRMLLIIFARYGRGCSIFSPAEDREMTSRFCSSAYAEAQYIAMHHYQLIDLLMEQITFCVLEGHIEFLKWSWLSAAIQHQTSYGCFGLTEEIQRTPKGRLRRARAWTLSKSLGAQNILEGKCNGHVTAAVAAALAEAVRFIIATAVKYPQHSIIILRETK